MGVCIAGTRAHKTNHEGVAGTLLRMRKKAMVKKRLKKKMVYSWSAEKTEQDSANKSRVTFHLIKQTQSHHLSLPVWPLRGEG